MAVHVHVYIHVHVYRERRSQKNFQLIVITHDMEFIDMLGQAGYTEHYYKVSKEVGYVYTQELYCSWLSFA